MIQYYTVDLTFIDTTSINSENLDVWKTSKKRKSHLNFSYLFLSDSLRICTIYIFPSSFTKPGYHELGIDIDMYGWDDHDSR